MTEPVLCRSTRNGAGCGHPVGDHDGDRSRTCCCCNWQHNDPAHSRGCVECHVRAVKARMRPGVTNAEVAPELPERLRQAFWARALDSYFARHLGGQHE